MISFGKAQFSYLFYVPLFIILITNQYINSDKIYANPIISGNITAFAAILAGLPKIIYDLYVKFRFLKKRHEERLLSPNTGFTYVTIKPNCLQSFFTMLLVVILALAQIVQDLFINIAYSNKKANSHLIYLLSVYALLMLFSYFFSFTIKLCRHHYVSMIFISIGISMILYNSVFYDIMIVIQPAQGIVMGLLYCGIKYVMDQKYIHPVNLIFYTGLFYIIILWLICLTCHYMDIYENLSKYMTRLGEDFSELWSSYRMGGIVVSKVIMMGIINVLSFTVIYYENPLINEGLNTFAFCFYMCIHAFIYDLYVNLLFYLRIFGTLFVTIGTMMLIEVFIVHCWKLDENTKKAIESRSNEVDNKEISMMIKIDVDD